MTDWELSPLPETLWPSLATVLSQVAGNDLPAVMQSVAEEVAALTDAVGVSLLCTSGGIARTRHGDWPAPAQSKVDAWERALMNRIREHLLTLPEGTLPVSVAAVSEWMVCSAPLTSADQVVGALSLCVPPDRQQQATRVARDLAPWLGILLRILQETEMTRRKLGTLGMIFHAGKARADAEEMRSPLQSTLRLASKLVCAQASLVFTLTEDGEHLHCLAADMPGEPVDWTGASLKVAGILGHACRSGETVLTNAPASDPRYAPEAEGVLLGTLHSILAVPLQVQESPRGVLVALNRQDPLGFTSDDAWLMEGVATYIAAALENAQLYRALREEQKRISRVQRSIRAEIANSLHQGAIQMLAAVTMGMDHLSQLAAVQPDALPGELESLKKLAREATREARLLLFELRPTILESEGLIGAIEAYTKQLPEEGAWIHFTHPDRLAEMSAPTAQAAFSIILQGLRHARQHGEAENVWVELVAEPQLLAITIEDDGKPHSQRRCLRREDESDCLEFVKEQAALVNGDVYIRDGSAEERPRMRIALPLSRR